MLKFIKSNKLVFLFLVVFAVSLVYSFSFHYKPLVDAKAYDKIAWNLAEGRGYRENLGGPLNNDHGITRAGPGYEFFLAAIYKISGRRYGAVWFLQAFFHAFSALLIFFIVKKILKHENAESMALLAMVFYGFSPDLIIMSSMLLTETLAIFLLVLNVFLFLKYFENQEMRWIFWLGLTVSFMVLVKSQLVLFILPLLVFWSLKKRWPHLIFFFILFILVLTPWTIRNYLVFEKIIPTAVILGNNLAMGNHPGATGEQMEGPYPPLDELFKQYGYIKGDELAVKFALSFIRENPWEFAKITLNRISVYFSSARPTGFWPNFSALDRIIAIIFSGIYSFLIFVLGATGILFSLKNRNRGLFFKEKLLYILFISALMPLSVIFIVVESRYRYPLYPFLAIFSGFSLYWLIKIRKEVLKFFLYSLAFIGGNGAFDVIRNWARIIARINNL